MGSARGALGPRRGDGVAAVRARSRRLRVAPAHAGGSRLARGGRIEELPARAAEYGHAGARAPRATSLRRHAAGTGRRSTARSASSRPPGPVARSSSSRRRSASWPPAGTPLEEIALVVPSIERWRASLETVLGTLGHPVHDRRPCPARPDPVRAGAAGAAPLRMAPGRPSRPLRLPPLALLRFHALERRLPRGPASRPRCLVARGGRGGDDQASRRAAAAAARGASQRRGAGRRRARGSPQRCCAGLTVSRRHRPGNRAAADLRAYDAILRVLDELDGWRALGGELVADEVLAALEHAEVRIGSAGEPRPGRGARPGARAHPSLRCRLPARARGGHAAAPRQSVAVPRRRRSRRARPGRAGPAPAARRRGA